MMGLSIYRKSTRYLNLSEVFDSFMSAISGVEIATEDSRIHIFRKLDRSRTLSADEVAG